MSSGFYSVPLGTFAVRFAGNTVDGCNVGVGGWAPTASSLNVTAVDNVFINTIGMWDIDLSTDPWGAATLRGDFQGNGLSRGIQFQNMGDGGGGPSEVRLVDPGQIGTNPVNAANISTANGGAPVQLFGTVTDVDSIPTP